MNNIFTEIDKHLKLTKAKFIAWKREVYVMKKENFVRIFFKPLGKLIEIFLDSFTKINLNWA